MTKNKKKFLFLYLRTGGGHLAPAKSVSDYLTNHFNEEAETYLFDGFEKSRKIAKLVVVDGYRILQSKAKWIYEFVYAIHKIKIISRISSSLVNLFIEKHLENKILGLMPDKIVVFHFFLIEPTYRVLKRRNLAIPVITVVTDPFTAPSLWFLNKDQNFILFSDKLKSRCIKEGINPDKIRVFNFPIQEKFSKIASMEEVNEYKKEFNLDSKKTLLILGGGEGIPKGIPIVKSICNKLKNINVVFVSGNNLQLYNQVKRLKEINGYGNLTVLGFTTKVYELLNISDAVITKCGASTIMEILTAGKIPIVNSYIWEQEKGNVNYLIENNFGIFEKRIPVLPVTIRELFSGKISKNFERVRRKNGVDEIAGFLISE